MKGGLFIVSQIEAFLANNAFHICISTVQFCFYVEYTYEYFPSIVYTSIKINMYMKLSLVGKIYYYLAKWLQ
jgi:hypothetical protein